MSNVKEWDRNETIGVTNTFKDSDDALYDPDSIELKIYAPSGSIHSTVTVGIGEIIKTSIGVWIYNFNIPDDASTGWWVTVWTATIATQKDVTRAQFFVRDPEEKLYCSPEQAWSRCGMGSEVASREDTIDFIRDAMDDIDGIMGRSFQYKQDKTDWFDTDMVDTLLTKNTVFLFKRPVQEVVSVKEFDRDNNFVKEYVINDDTLWKSGTIYTAGDVVASTVDNEYVYECTVGGTSDVTEPTWPLVLDDTVVDNTVTWKCIASLHEYWIDYGTGMVKLTSEEFTQQPMRLQVVYKYGYDRIPRKIGQLCTIMAGQSVLLKFAGASYDDVTSWSAAGLSIGVGEPYMNATRTFELLNKQKDKLLAGIGRLRTSIVIL